MSALDDFVRAARELCAWCEAAPGEPEAEVRTALRLLSRLYVRALELEQPEEGLTEDLEVELDDETWRRVYRRVGAIPLGMYGVTLDPHAVLPEFGVGDLADDLADIHRDLSEGLWLYDRGFRVDAQWTFAFTFQAHWGRHAVEALWALHLWLDR